MAKKKPQQKKGFFTSFAKKVSSYTGKPQVFFVAILLIAIWALTGPVFGYSDTWQLIVNTSTTIITFLMVFLIQNTQNRDTEALQLKLDELIRATEGTHNALLDLEELDEEELDQIRDRYEAIAAKARAELKKGGSDTNTPAVKINP